LGILLCLQYGIFAGEKASELQGAWTVVSFESRGEPEKKHVGLKVIFDGDKVTIKDGKKDEAVPFVLDTTKKPKQINIDRKAHAIYSVDGDTLKICFDKLGDSEKDRPTEFVSKKDGDRELVLMVLKRDKK
jgi:uncharacterized protein (TIGR03067 family)